MLKSAEVVLLAVPPPLFRGEARDVVQDERFVIVMFFTFLPIEISVYKYTLFIIHQSERNYNSGNENLRCGGWGKTGWINKEWFSDACRANNSDSELPIVLFVG